MIRIRHTNGKVEDKPDAAFVEICSTDGLLAAVIFTDASGVTRVVDNTDDAFHRYLRMFGIKNHAPVEEVKL